MPRAIVVHVLLSTTNGGGQLCHRPLNNGDDVTTLHSQPLTTTEVLEALIEIDRESDIQQAVADLFPLPKALVNVRKSMERMEGDEGTYALIKGSIAARISRASRSAFVTSSKEGSGVEDG